MPLALNRFSISDIEKLTGIKAHTIRIWETRYNLLEPKRTETNIRYYDDEDLRFFLNVAALLKNGYKISKIAAMDKLQIAAVMEGLGADDNNHDMRIQALTAAALKLEHDELNQILENCIVSLGFVNAVTGIFFPFLNKIGHMWQSGIINPAHEHFATNLIRQKIIAAIDALPHKLQSDSKRFMLFLPQNEMHDSGLLLAYYLLKAAGHHVLYLGQNMPFQDIMPAASYYNPDYAITALTLPHGGETVGLVNRLLACLPQWPLIISGALVAQAGISPRPGLHIIKDFSEFVSFIG